MSIKNQIIKKDASFMTSSIKFSDDTSYTTYSFNIIRKRGDIKFITKNSLRSNPSVYPEVIHIETNNIAIQEMRYRQDIHGVKIKKGSKQHKMNFKSEFAEIVHIENLKDFNYSINKVVILKKKQYCCGKLNCLIY